MPEAMRGFILQPTYRVDSGRPVVRLYGRLEDGRTFLVRDRREVPHFYVEADDRGRAWALGARPLAPTGQVTLSGRPVVRVEVPAPADTPPLRERLTRAGIACHEADVRFAMRYLIDHGLKGSLAIRGKPQPGTSEGVDLVFDEPELASADWTPRPSLLSLDIETDPKAQSLLSIAIHGCGVAEVFLLTPLGWACPEDALPFPGERELITAFVRRVVELDPDVLTGWNVVDFDLAVLGRLASRLGVRLDLGRGPGSLRIREMGARGARQASVPGRIVLDGIQLLRGAFVRMQDYGLDAVAREVLGEGKLFAGHDRAEEILRLFRHDRARFVHYNLTDARLAREILEKLELVELAVERSRLTGMPLDRVSSSIAAFDFLYLSELRQRGVVAPSVSGGDEEAAATEGGHVLEPLPGLYSNVLVFDFKSLYPSLIRTFEIDPWNLIREAPAGTDAIIAPNGAAFRRRRGILTEILDLILPRREAARRAGDRVKSHAIKILMNSFYGCLGTSASRFHDPRLANAITSFGRDILLWCRDRLEEQGRRVLYGDTDSLFVESGEVAPEASRRVGEALAARLNVELAAHIERTWRVKSRLELRFERLYLRLLLPAVRHGTAGARKRYAGLVAGAGAGSKTLVAFTGMEAVRGDWTELAKQVQRGLYARLFADQPVEDYLRGMVAELRAGACDERLVYHKALRKAPAAYTATTPPHVAAARKLGRLTRGRIAYVLTVEGPEPVAERHHPIDYDHYVEKQIRPVAEPVLAILGLDFDTLVGRERQLSLFD